MYVCFIIMFYYSLLHMLVCFIIILYNNKIYFYMYIYFFILKICKQEIVACS